MLSSGKLLIIGTCLLMKNKDLVAQVAKDYDGNVLNICLEEMHYNQYMSKMHAILDLGKITELGILTVDGSPHCAQLHFGRKYLQRGLKFNVNFKHFVITSKGELLEIPQRIVDDSKEFAKAL